MEVVKQYRNMFYCCTNSTNLQHHKCTGNGILLLVDTVYQNVYLPWLQLAISMDQRHCPEHCVHVVHKFYISERTPVV